MRISLKHNFVTRFRQTLFFTLKTVSPNVLGFVISWLVIRIFSPELWGSVVEQSLWVFVLGNIASWGSRDFLLRAFSKKPKAIIPLFCSSLKTRALIIPVLLLLLWLHTGNQTELFLLCGLWIISRFFYQSFDSLVYFEKKFGFLLLVEGLGGMAAIMAILLLRSYLDTLLLLGILMASDWLKTIFMGVFFRGVFRKFFTVRIDKNHLLGAFSFVAIGLLGLLGSRIDQFVVYHFLPQSEKAFYQVFLNLIILILMIPGIAITPVIKNMYRSKEIVFHKLQWLLLKTGLIVIPTGVFFIWIIMHFVYGFKTDFVYLVLGGLLVTPAFIHSSYIFLLYKNNKQSYILIASLVSLIINFVLCLLLVPNYNTLGAFIGAVAGQWSISIFILIAYLSGYLNGTINKNPLMKEVEENDHS